MSKLTQRAGAVEGEPRMPWGRPKHELLLLVLVAVAALTPIYAVSAQDVSRLCLTRSLLEGRVTISPCVGHAFDQARFAGRAYSDKAPGMSVLALPVAETVGLPAPSRWRPGRDLRVWIVRVLTSGLAFLFLAFAVGRVSEGLFPHTGGVALVAFALGTIVEALAATTISHVTAGAFCFAAFLLAWRKRPVVAGLLGGVALIVEYQTGIVVAVLAVYVGFTHRRSLLRYAAGVVPGVLLLGAYDWVAFGSPLHLSYRYVANKYAAEQSQGLFGISVPGWHSIMQVLVGDRGLLLVCPIALVALFGLGLLARRHRAEAATCVVIFLGFLGLSFGYFLPYGGVSPGPRFLVPALPFLAVGLGPAFARFPVISGVLAVPSLIASTTLTLTWALEGYAGYRQTVWGELARLLTGSGSRLSHDLASNLTTIAGAGRAEGALLVAGCTLAAFAVALDSLRGLPRGPRESRVIRSRAIGGSGAVLVDHRQPDGSIAFRKVFRYLIGTARR